MAKKVKADFDALIARAKEQKRANKWKPTEGGSIVGTVIGMKWIRGKGKDDEGKNIPYLSVTLQEPDGGDRVVVNCGLILQEEFELQEVKKGETVAIFYHGKEGRTGIYSLATERE